MSIALFLLKQGTTLVAQSEQLEAEPKVHLLSPYAVSGKTKITLTEWPDYSEDDHILLHSDSLLTVCEPSPKVKQAYLDKLGTTEEVLNSATKPVILTEEDNPDPILDDEEYEPRYVEEPIY